MSLPVNMAGNKYCLKYKAFPHKWKHKVPQEVISHLAVSNTNMFLFQNYSYSQASSTTSLRLLSRSMRGAMPGKTCFA